MNHPPSSTPLSTEAHSPGDWLASSWRSINSPVVTSVNLRTSTPCAHSRLPVTTVDIAAHLFRLVAVHRPLTPGGVGGNVAATKRRHEKTNARLWGVCSRNMDHSGSLQASRCQVLPCWRTCITMEVLEDMHYNGSFYRLHVIR